MATGASSLSGPAIRAARYAHAKVVAYGAFWHLSRIAERLLFLFVLWALLAGVSVWLDVGVRLRPAHSLTVRIAGLAVLLGLAYIWIRPLLLVRPHWGRLSTDLERQLPGFANRLVTLEEFRREAALPGGGILGYFSPALVDAFFEECRRTVCRRTWARLFLRWTLAASLLGAGGVILVAVNLVALTPLELDNALDIYFAPFHRSPFFDPTVILVDPGDASIARGEDLAIQVRVYEGPRAVPELHFRSGETPADVVPMNAGSEEQWDYSFRNVQDSFSYWISVGKKKSPSYTVRVVERIRPTHVSVVCTYPAYLEMGMRIRPRDVGAITEPKGTRCRFSVQFNRSPDRAFLKVRGAGRKAGLENIDLEVGEGYWQAELTVVDDGSYSIAAEASSGRSGESDSYPIRAIRDARPNVELVRPGGDLDLSEGGDGLGRIIWEKQRAMLEVEYAAGDDFSLRRAEILVKDRSGKDLGIPKASVFSATAVRETHPISLTPHWGGEDIWVSVRVTDSLAYNADLSGSVYPEEEIAAHRVESGSRRIFWKEPEGDRSESAESADQKGSSGEQQVSELGEEVGKIRDEQKKLDKRVRQKKKGEEQGEGKKSDRSESGTGSKEGSGRDRQDLADEQRDLARRTAEASKRAENLSKSLHERAESSPEAVGKGKPTPDLDRQGRLEAMADKLEDVGKRLSKDLAEVEGRHRYGVAHTMERNAGRLESGKWDRAQESGEGIERQLDQVGDLLAQARGSREVGREEGEDSTAGKGDTEGTGMGDAGGGTEIGDSLGGGSTAPLVEGEKQILSPDAARNLGSADGTEPGVALSPAGLDGAEVRPQVYVPPKFRDTVDRYFDILRKTGTQKRGWQR